MMTSMAKMNTLWRVVDKMWMGDGDGC